MATYYFHIKRGQDLLRDDEGSDCESMNLAHVEAARALRELIAHDILYERSGSVTKVIIADDADREVATLDAAEVLRDYLHALE